MKFVILLTLLTLLTLVSPLATSAKASEPKVCFTDSKRSETSEMLKAVTARKFEAFIQQYEALCSDYPTQLDCSVEKLPSGKDKARARELTKADKCLFIAHVTTPEGVSLYKLTDKVYPAK